MIWHETEVNSQGTCQLFYSSICNKIPLSRSKQQLECLLFEAEHNQSETYRSGNNPKEHSAEHFQMSAECHQDIQDKFVNRNDSDFQKLNEVATFFAREQGAEVILTPKMSRPTKFQYECVYSSLIGTKYEGKCPDLNVDGAWYEHEGFISDNPKRAFRNMLNDGLKQANRLIIDKPNLTDAYMKRIIRQRIKDGQDIEEIWIKESSELRILYKKSEE